MATLIALVLSSRFLMACKNSLHNLFQKQIGVILGPFYAILVQQLLNIWWQSDEKDLLPCTNFKITIMRE